MSSKKPRDSTRARKAPSAKPSPKPRGKASPAPALTDVGKALRSVAMLLKQVESYLIVCHLALKGQDVEQDNEVAKLLKRGVGDLLFKQIRALENVAARCDGGPRSDREDDDEFEDDDTEGGLP